MLEAFLFLSGRLGRLAYFGYSILLWLVLTLIAVIMVWPAYKTPNQDTVILLASLIVGALAIWGGLALTVKRLHDLDMSGWHYLWMGLLPALVNGVGRGMHSLPITIAGVVLSLVFGLFLLFWPGTDGSNAYGYRP
jgi:uncharacterized membrane protein YhaH (DUF805 family)